jgi:hypothetical protein
VDDLAASGILKTTGYQGRYLQFSWNIKSSDQDRVTSNKTVIAWTLKGGGDASAAYYETGNITLVVDGVTVYTRAKFDRIKLYNGTQVASGEVTFTHDVNGKKSFDVSLEAGIYLAEVNCTGAGSFDVDDIPKASGLVAYRGLLGQEHTLTIVPAASTFKHKLTYKCGDVVDYIVGSLTEYYTGDPAVKWTPPIGLAAQNTTGTNVTVTLTLYTFTSSGTHVGTVTETINCAIPASVAPSCTIRTPIIDTTDATSLYGKPVQGVSKLQLSIGANTSQGSEIESYSLEFDGAKYDKQTVTTDVLKASGTLPILASVKDKRGRTGSAQSFVDVLAYTLPVISSLSVSRYNENGKQDNQGGICRITFSASVSPLRVGNQYKNKTVYTAEYKKPTDSGYTKIDTSDIQNGLSVIGQTYDFAADPNTTYEVRVTVEDNHGKDTRTTTLSTAFTLMNWNAAGNGMGIGKVSEKERTLEIGMDTDFFGDVYGRAYGLGGLPAIPSGASMNDYLVPGVYAARTTEIAQTIKNIPVQLAGRLIVSSALGQTVAGDAEYRYIEQKYIPFSYGVPELDQPAYLRYIVQEGAESVTYREWFNEALKAYPIGSIHIRYDHKPPAELFGGTWERISSYLLRGATEGGTIGGTVGLADGSGRTAINVSIWRRTA